MGDHAVDAGEDGMSQLAFLGQFGDAIQFIFEGETSQEGAEIGGWQFVELTWEHVKLSLAAMAIACLISVPIGLWLGHIRRFSFVAISASNVGRAVPSLALIAFFVAYLGVGFTNLTLALVLLAIPPILSNTFAGVQNVSPAVRDAAFGMGMTGRQTLLRVELPNALPLIFSGFRSATLQVIATATIASYVTLGGLGRFIYDGLAQQDFPQMISGGLLVALLALVADLLLATVQRYTVSRGITGRHGGSDSRVAALTEEMVSEST
ncbi:MAG: ABC transporter permease [Actinomycetota bacterium]|nr:ABC transporter permease [Actinomycetota bacterium]